MVEHIYTAAALEYVRVLFSLKEIKYIYEKCYIYIDRALRGIRGCAGYRRSLYNHLLSDQFEVDYP